MYDKNIYYKRHSNAKIRIIIDYLIVNILDLHHMIGYFDHQHQCHAHLILTTFYSVQHFYKKKKVQK